MVEKPHFYKMFKYSKINKTQREQLIKCIKIINNYKLIYFRCQVDCGGGILVNTNLGATNVFYKTSVLKM